MKRRDKEKGIKCRSVSKEGKGEKEERNRRSSRRGTTARKRKVKGEENRKGIKCREVRMERKGACRRKEENL